jgi:gliding motility-associated-like protein
MKKYNDIGDLYREKFADYSPEPPASVWEGIKSATEKRPSLWKKLTYPFAGTVLIGAVVYLIIANPKLQESAVVMVNDNQKNAENQLVNEVFLTDNNQSGGLNERNAPISQQINQVEYAVAPATQNVTPNDLSNNNLPEEKQVIEERIIDDKKVPFLRLVSETDERNPKQNTVKQTQSENPQPKVLPVKISKDTTICEDADVKLYAYNAENIRWNTGETKNLITVHPSHSEQYSVTFSTANAKDTTIYIYVNVVQCSEVYIPNTFTPNGDGLNDVFLIETDMALKSFEMTIYSKDGRQIFFNSKDTKRGWDGTYNGQSLPHGNYPYTIRYTDNLGKTIEKSGVVSLKLQ